MEFWRDTFFVQPTSMQPLLSSVPVNSVVCVSMTSNFYDIQSTVGVVAQKKTDNPEVPYQSIKAALQASKCELLEVKENYDEDDILTSLIVLNHVDGMISDFSGDITLYIHGGGRVTVPFEQAESLLTRYQTIQTADTPLVHTSIHHCYAPNDMIEIVVKPHLLNKIHVAVPYLSFHFGNRDSCHHAESRYSQTEIEESFGRKITTCEHVERLNEMAGASIEKAVMEMISVNPGLPVGRNVISAKDPAL